MVTPIILKGSTNYERVRETEAHLETGIANIFASPNYAEYLKAMSKFTCYSAKNALLIILQGGTLVAGYNKWKKVFNRQVKKGSKGIKIFAPCISKKKDDDEEDNVVTYYKVINVFDISQTEGDPLPEIPVKDLEEDLEHYQKLYSAILKVSKVPVEFEDMGGSTHGYYNIVDKRIAIKKNLSNVQTVKTLIHEITHSILHDPDLFQKKEEMPDSRSREVQAESVAYIVCNYFGIDTSDYSFGYIARWSSGVEMKELVNSMNIIHNTAVKLITEINGNII